MLLVFLSDDLQVFETLIVLPSPEENASNYSTLTPYATATSHGRTRRRRFVVLRKPGDDGTFVALCVACPYQQQSTTDVYRPIKTYGGLGVAAPHVTRSHHAIIYTGPNPPLATSQEGPRRLETARDMLKPDSIRVIPLRRDKTLDEMSRLDLGDLTRFDCEVKVRLFGQVHEDSMRAFLYQFRDVYLATRHSDSKPESRPPTNFQPSSGVTPARQQAQSGQDANPVAAKELVDHIRSLRERASRRGVSFPIVNADHIRALLARREAKKDFLARWNQVLPPTPDESEEEDDDDEDEEEGSSGYDSG